MSNEGLRIRSIYDAIDPETGETYKQGNLKKQHNIPIGALVEVKFDDWFGDGACWKVHARLWVVRHMRDCDGTPLYVLSRWNDSETQDGYHGFIEKDFTIVEITEELRRGQNVLAWPEPEESV